MAYLFIESGYADYAGWKAAGKLALSIARLSQTYRESVARPPSTNKSWPESGAISMLPVLKSGLKVFEGKK